jgi:hypothetical protein
VIPAITLRATTDGARSDSSSVEAAARTKGVSPVDSREIEEKANLDEFHGEHESQSLAIAAV